MAPGKEKAARLDKIEPCPCESGKAYGDCCWKKPFEFHRNERGEIFKTAPIGEELSGLLELQLAEFKKIFGRSPGRGDPVIFDKYFYSAEDYSEQFRAAAEAADIPPELIYASEKTGFIVGEETWEILTKTEQDEWTSAIEELFEKEKTGTHFKNNASERASEVLSALRADVFASVCHVGAFLEKSPNSKYRESDFLQ